MKYFILFFCFTHLLFFQIQLSGVAIIFFILIARNVLLLLQMPQHLPIVNLLTMKI